MTNDIKKDPTIFDYINDISFNKDYIYSPMLEKNYNQFMINRGLGQHIDTVLLANEANKMELSNLMHFDFLFHIIDKKKRYGRWVKKDESDLELIGFLQEKYNINKDIAIYYMKMMNRDDLIEAYDMHNKKGGKQ